MNRVPNPTEMLSVKKRESSVYEIKSPDKEIFVGTFYIISAMGSSAKTKAMNSVFT